METSRRGVLSRSSALRICVPSVSHSPPPTPRRSFKTSRQVSPSRILAKDCVLPFISASSQCARGFVCTCSEWSLCLPHSCQTPAVRAYWSSDVNVKDLFGLIHWFMGWSASHLVNKNVLPEAVCPLYTKVYMNQWIVFKLLWPEYAHKCHDVYKVGAA